MTTLGMRITALTIAMLAAYLTVGRAAQGQDTAQKTTPSQVSADPQAVQGHNRGIETVVLIRHGEKPAKGLGLLTCKGLNRALLLPDFFATNFNRPDHIFAPNPSVRASEIHGDGQRL